MGSRSVASAFPCLVTFSVLTQLFFQLFFFLPHLVNAQPHHLYCVLPLLLQKGSSWAFLKEDGFLDAAGIAAVEELHLQKKTDCKC